MEGYQKDKEANAKNLKQTIMTIGQNIEQFMQSSSDAEHQKNQLAELSNLLKKTVNNAVDNAIDAVSLLPSKLPLYPNL